MGINYLNKFSKFLKLLSDREKERKAFFCWLCKYVKTEDSILFVDSGILKKLAFKFPVRSDDKPEIIEWEGNHPNFIFLEKGSEKRIPSFFKGNWMKIGEGFFFSLFENKNRFDSIIPLPLRFNLTEEEKKQAIKIARLAIEKFLDNQEEPSQEDFKKLPPRFFNRSDLDVALWVNGHLRGSCPVENENFFNGIKKAATRAARDSRFKPITKGDFPHLRIEITLMSDLRLPVPRSFIQKNELISDKGFRLTFQDKVGLFLPEVFNVRRFKDLNEFLNTLSSEKARIESENLKNDKETVEIFEVDDFIEDHENETVLTLFGPVVIKKNHNDLKARGIIAADWLVNIQESDGNFPPIINPLSGYQAQIDWPRNAFSGWALIEYSSSIKVEKYLMAGEKHFAFLNENLSKNLFLDTNTLLLTFAYAGQEALALFRATNNKNYYLTAKKFGKIILDETSKMTFEAITYEQISSFFIELALYDKEFFEKGVELAIVAKKNFEDGLEKKIKFNLAVQAELVNTFDKIFKINGDTFYKEFSRRVARWLLKYQLTNTKIAGPFKKDTESDFVYMRGTAKIFEVLASLPEFKNETKHVLDWILTMQYTRENTFFVPSEIIGKVIGGFRHDYFNQELWIDSVGHFLLGLSRL